VFNDLVFFYSQFGTKLITIVSKLENLVNFASRINKMSN